MPAVEVDGRSQRATVVVVGLLSNDTRTLNETDGEKSAGPK